MNSKSRLRALILALVVLSVAGCGRRANWHTVSEVWQNADSLQGKRIRVRGQADFDFFPRHPMQTGGCSPDQDFVKSTHFVGQLALLDQDSPDPKHRLSISESSLQCEGTVCSIVCTPFGPTDTWGRIGVVEVFEFVGVLRVDGLGSKTMLTLEDIDLQASRRMTDGEWGPIQTGDFTYVFP